MNTKENKALFWGCFIAIVTTSYAFFSRIYLCQVRFPGDFGIDNVHVGELIGAGIWPFGVSIILFGLLIDRIGYKVAMTFSFLSYIVYTLMAFHAYGIIHGVTGADLKTAQTEGYKWLYWGSVVLALGNGTVEAFANPLVATVFSKNKVKWLNALHAGWAGGLVIGGLCTIYLADQAATGDWRIVLGLIMVPAILSFLMLIGQPFPRNEREQAGIGYLDMLKEFGAFGAFVGFGLIISQLGQVYDWKPVTVWGLIAAVVALFGVVTRSFGRPFLAMLIIIMIPLATTELGTDGWITSLMNAPMSAAGHNPGWVLVYTSAIMLVLRFSAGGILHKVSPLGLLCICTSLAILGLIALSKTGSAGILGIFAAATLYGMGKSFFWPTMLAVTSEQCPKGGALTLNALGGIGMLAVGILGIPFIGYVQDTTASKNLELNSPAIAQQVTSEKTYFYTNYKSIDPDKAAKIDSTEGKAALAVASKASQFDALGKMAFFPAFMLCCYIGLFLYFKSRGGYKAVDIAAAQGSPSV